MIFGMVFHFLFLHRWFMNDEETGIMNLHFADHLVGASPTDVDINYQTEHHYYDQIFRCNSSFLLDAFLVFFNELKLTKSFFQSLTGLGSTKKCNDRRSRSKQCWRTTIWNPWILTWKSCLFSRSPYSYCIIFCWIHPARLKQGGFVELLIQNLTMM